MRYLLPLLLALAPLPLAHAQDTTPTPMETPPPPAAPRPVIAPKPQETKLANGLRVICVPRPGSGLVTARLTVRGAGTAAEQDRYAGAASMVASLLNKGTKTRSATQIAQAVERLGASLDAGAGYDSASITLTVLKDRFSAALPLLTDIVRNPTLPEGELARLRTQTLDDLSVSYRQPGSLARIVAARVLFKNGPYGSPVSGTPETLRRITRSQLVSWHRAVYAPETSIFTVAGDITPTQAAALARREFGTWKRQGGASTAIARSPVTKEVILAPTRQIVVVDRPDAGQSAVLVTRLGIARSDPDYVLAQLTNDILGGGYSSRLNREVRIKRGLSYGAGSRLDARLAAGPLTETAQTKNESAGEVARLLVDELGRLGTEPVPDSELAARKSALAGDFSRSLETTAGLAALVNNLAVYDRPFSELQSYLPTVEASTAAQVQSYAAQHFSPTQANVVIVGNAAKFLPDLKTRFTGETVTVIPFGNLDLNSVGLLKGGK